MKLDLCIPAYNEASIIKESIERIRRSLERDMPGEWRIVVSDNGSTDGTAEVVESIGDSRIQVLRTEEKGKGAAIIAAARMCEDAHASFGFIDADLSASPDDINNLMKIVEEDGADIAIGSRLMDEHLVKRGVLRTLSSRIFNLLRWWMLGIQVEDSQCGLKIMNARGRDVLRTCVEHTWFIDVELLARAEREALRIREVPIHWDEHQFPGRASKLHVLQEGVRAIQAFIRIKSRLARYNRPTHGA